MAWTERYVRADAAGGGNGTTDTNSGGSGAWTLAEAVTNVAAGHRVNVRAGTYANTTTTRTFVNAGTTTAPIWWRGFTSTAGDLDTEPTTARVPGTDQPHWTSTTGRVIFSGAYQMVTNLAVTCTGAVNANLFSVSGSNFKGHRIRVDNQDANAAAYAVSVSGSGNVHFTASAFKATSTASFVVYASAASAWHGCTFEGGGIGLNVENALQLMQSVFNNHGSHGVQMNATSPCVVLNNSFYSVGGDGLRFTTAMSTFGLVINNIFSEGAGWGINNSTGANTANIQRIGNLFYNNASGTTTGFGDMPSLAEQTDSATPYTAAGSANFTLVSTSNAKGHGVPELYENQTYSSALDLGAVQIVEPTDAEIATAVWSRSERTLTS